MLLRILLHIIFVLKKQRIFPTNHQNEGQSVQQQLMVSEKRLNELCHIKHDLKNQYAYMSVLLEGKKFDELEAFFDEVTRQFLKETVCKCR